MRWTRCAFGVVVAACSASDGPATDPAQTCTVRVEDSFGSEELVYVFAAPGRPASQTWSRDGVIQSYWEYTYDDAANLILEAQDCCGGMPSRPDGVFDNEIRYEHTATSTISRYFATGAEAPLQSSEMLLDASDRVIRATQGEGAATTGLESIEYMLNDDGTVARRDIAGNDIDLGPFTSVDTYRYEAGRLVERSTTDSRLSGTSTSSFAYDSQPDRLVLTRSDVDGVGSRYTYHHDAEGRLSRIELAETLDGPTDVVTDFAYDGDAVTATLTRLSSSSPRTYSYSSACAFHPTAPTMPTSGVRPGNGWRASQYPFVLFPIE